MNRLIDIDRLQKEFEMVCVGECDSCGREEGCPVYTQPTVNAIPIPEGATNGAMIKAMFPNARVSEIFPSFNGDEVYYVSIEKFNGITNEMRVMKSWWNAPYKVEGEEKE